MSDEAGNFPLTSLNNWEREVVLAELKRREPEGIADLGDFKQRLLRANQAGLLSLSRADLVEAMDPADVRASEISSLGATFHFVRVD